MRAIIDWAAQHTRMAIGFIVLSLVVGAQTYLNLPKEGEPDIEIPAVFISVPFPGISAEDAEKLLLKPMETEMSSLDGLDRMTGTASEGYAVLVMEFDFGWDKTATLADVRAAMNKAEALFPAGAEQYTVDEFNFSEFPIIIVNLSGPLPERTLLRVANDLQDKLESLEPVLEAALTGHRDEMVEVIIDPLKLEAYNVTADELIASVVGNNQLIAAGEVTSAAGAFALKIPSSFATASDIFDIPVKVNGDFVVTLGDLATISLTFEDREGTARFDGEKSVALQVVKRKGYNVIDTAALVRETVEKERASWPPELRDAIVVGTSNDQSVQVASMVRQLEGSVLTAIGLVMIVILATLGPRPALLVGFSIPMSFLLSFVFLAVMGVTISNMVMFGLILAVGMLVDASIVVVEYADTRIEAGTGPMHAYVEAAKRMFWPVVSSTLTTLCAFLPMLFWPGVSGEFMKMLPITLIFVLSASLIVALVFLPVVGGITGRVARRFHHIAEWLRRWPWALRAALVLPSLYLIFLGAMQVLNPGYLLPAAIPAMTARLIGVLLLFLGSMATSLTADAAKPQRQSRRVTAGYRRTPFGYLIRFLVANPVMPVITVLAVALFEISVFTYFSEHGKGTEFFVASEPEQAIIYVRARGNLSVDEKDALVAQVEKIAEAEPGVDSVFAFAVGAGGLNANTGGTDAPRDTIGQLQIEMIRWEDRKDQPELDGNLVLARLQEKFDQIPGIYCEVLDLAMGPGSGKPIHLRLTGDDWDDLRRAVEIARAKFAATPGLTGIEDTLPLPGIDWQIDVDVAKAGRYGANVATVGAMVQLVTRGILLDTMRVDSSDEEIDIRVRLPEADRLLSTLDSLKVRTPDGLVPLSNFITRKPVPKLARIDRVDGERYYDVKADVTDGLVSLVNGDGETVGIVTAEAAETSEAGRIQSEGLSVVPLTATERIALLTQWMEAGDPFGPDVGWQWTGDEEEQQDSQAFLSQAFLAALGLMFIILLTQFNSLYNSVLVLLAVVLSTSGVLVGMIVMDQTFSIIMTGTGIVALAGIVVNNNIVLIDTYQEFRTYMPPIEAIIRTAEQRLRPVMLTTLTTMAGLLPMMLGISLDFIGGGYTIDSPTALWWKQLATAVVFGLGIATVLTLVITPALLAIRVWFWQGAYRSLRALRALSGGRDSREARDLALTRSAHNLGSPELIWLPDAPVERQEKG